MNEEQEDRDLVGRCLAGDLEAFGGLVERYQGPVFRVVLHMVSSYEDAQEVSQQVFLKAFEHLSSFDPNRRFFSWIYRIAVNESINHVHARKNFETLDNEQQDGHRNPLQSYEATERSRMVREAVMSLSPTYREVIVLRHFLSLSYQEAADVLQVPEKTVKSRLFTARQLLKESLSDSGGDRQ
ncbi:MAG: RNA polymerase sigma factor [Acidobacteriota bacterium]